MSKISKLVLLSLALVAFVTLAFASTAFADSPIKETCRGNCNGTSSNVYAQGAALTDQEEDWLTYMREEEKLARDVYLAFYDKYQLRIFKNIATSEQKHMDAVKTLLNRYAIEDPAADNEQGEFTNPKRQDLYNQLIQQGSVSTNESLEAGILIEETDIDDLNAAIASTTHNDIKRVYSNLLQGSQNHLKAFTSNLATISVTK